MKTIETERPESDGPKPYTALSLLSAMGCGLVALNLFDQNPYRINPEPGVLAYLVLVYLAIWPLRWLWLCRKIARYFIRDLPNSLFTVIKVLWALILLLLGTVLGLVCVVAWMVLFFNAISSLSPLTFLLCLILWAVIAGASGIESAIRSQGRNQYTE